MIFNARFSGRSLSDTEEADTKRWEAQPQPEPAGADEVAGGTGRADGMVHVLSIDLQSNGGFFRFVHFSISIYLCICIQVFIILVIVADSLGIRLSTIEDPATPQGHLAVSRQPITICVLQL